MIVLGVDPGSRRTGYGAISVEGDRLHCLDCGVISTGQTGKNRAITHRLLIIYEKLESLIRKISPEVIAVEEVFYAVNVKSALTLGHVRGVVLLAASQMGIPLVEYAPLEVKKAVVGYGRADKKQIQAMVKVLLNLRKEPEPHDAADALAIALCHSFSSSLPKHKQGRWRSYNPDPARSAK
jgi:crossover junction endodeoxyribonuclease RuvC